MGFCFQLLLFITVFVFISVPSYAIYLPASSSSLWRFGYLSATDEKGRTMAPHEREEEEGSGEEEDEVMKLYENGTDQQQKRVQDGTAQSGDDQHQTLTATTAITIATTAKSTKRRSARVEAEYTTPAAAIGGVESIHCKMPAKIFGSSPPRKLSLRFSIWLLLSLFCRTNSSTINTAPAAPTVQPPTNTIIRLSLNLPQQPFTAELSHSDSSAFQDASEPVREALDYLWRGETAYRGSSVRRFRYQPILGILVSVDAHFANVSSISLLHKLRWELVHALRAGKIEWLTVSADGFEFNPIEGPFAKPTLACPDGTLPSFSLHGSTYCWSHSVCPSATSCVEGQCCKSGPFDRLRRCNSLRQWECADGLCIPLAGRCDGHADCKDEESALGSRGTLHDSTDELYCHTGEFCAAFNSVFLLVWPFNDSFYVLLCLVG
uniref:SEA domain-containing protein n=1 Tax=Globodera rostochiensis TaxID=31243 RepID=A0A914HQM4_GLORO